MVVVAGGKGALPMLNKVGRKGGGVETVEKGYVEKRVEKEVETLYEGCGVGGSIGIGLGLMKKPYNSR